jgi:hypothetical protein
MREQGISWLKDNYKADYAPKLKPKTSVSRTPSRKRKMDMDSFFCDDEEDEEDEVEHANVVESDLSQVEDYLALSQLNEGMSFDILDWWRRKKEVWPNLAKMARQYLSLPATSGVVERLFSTSGVMNGDLRKNIKEETMELLLGVNKNG